MRHLETIPSYRNAVAYRKTIPPRPARYQRLAQTLPDDITRILRASGVQRFYTHQAEAIDLLREGKNVVIATSTASGKSVCYQTPTIETLTARPRTTALYIFPTKTLAQDQLHSIREMLPEEASIEVNTFDADTPTKSRREIKNRSRIIISNPDMLHMSTLPWHRGWAKFLSGLSIVVIDESHTYRGIFGSHVAMIMRRLRRLCAMYRSDPVFALCSASIANPIEHAESLIGLPFDLVDNDGSPAGAREFVFWRTTDERGRKLLSMNKDAADISSDLIERGIRIMTFAKTTRETERIYAMSSANLKEGALDISDSIMPYRAGYMPEYRREVESRLKTGDINGVITTNAMELGVDIGHLGATVLAGYPGTVASTWQRVGRAGRDGKTSVAILICSDHAIDQFMMRHPGELFGSTTEHARISLTNPTVATGHILAAASEIPLGRADFTYFDEQTTRDITAELMESGKLTFNPHSKTRRPSPGIENPAYHINIRSVSGDFYTICDARTGEIIEKVQNETAFRDIYPGAVYSNKGQTRVIKNVNKGKRQASAVAGLEPNYLTEADITTEISVQKLTRQRYIIGERAVIHLGQLKVTHTRAGYVRKSRADGKLISRETFRSPAKRSFQTTGLWINADPATLRTPIFAGDEESLHAIEHSGINALTILSMSDPGDLKGLIAPAPGSTENSVFLFDSHEGGAGITELGYENAERFLSIAGAIMDDCGCFRGCPLCVETYHCESQVSPDSRGGASLIRYILTGSVNTPEKKNRSHTPPPNGKYAQGRLNDI